LVRLAAQASGHGSTLPLPPTIGTPQWLTATVVLRVVRAKK
jgi:hypothetical protein